MDGYGSMNNSMRRDSPAVGSGSVGDAKEKSLPAYKPDDTNLGGSKPSGGKSGRMDPNEAYGIVNEAPGGGFGSLSAKYESGGKSTSVSYDDTGGWSYGKYQFVGGGKTADGSSMRNFLSTLKGSDPEAYSKLEGAGGFAAARSGSRSFRSAWKEVADRPGFQQAEAENARSTLFAPAARRVAERTGLDVSQRSPALQEVLFSTAIQHGPGGSANLWRNALSGTDPSALSDADIINRLYDERSKTNIYFKSSNQNIKASVASRFGRERNDALALLGQQPVTAPAQAQAAQPRGLPPMTQETGSLEPQRWGLLQQLMNAKGT
ncbi:hypothetical protein V5F77_04415 [Xanthobacter sp. DSM 24535]|uniref:VgrG-related protein n=1 Tax=Roseixanthobacter psychrophilus TaxID=3119917 RepID=UPI0037291383